MTGRAGFWVVLGVMAKSLEKLSSGFRINRAADDAAGLAISEGLRSQVGGNRQAVRNAQDGISLVQTAEGALNEVHSILQRMRVLAVQGATDSNSADARDNINTELGQLRDELERIGNVTNFNGTQLLDGSASGSRALKFQVGANGNAHNRITVDLADADVTAISKFATSTMVSNVYTATTKAAIGDATKEYTLDIEGKLVTFKGGAKAEDIKKNLGEALAKAEVSGYVEGTVPTTGESAVLETDANKTDLGGKYHLTIGGEKLTVEVEKNRNDTAEQVAQKLQAKISESSNLAGYYQISATADDKFEVKLTDKAISEGRRTATVTLETEAAGAKTKKLIDNKAIGVNGGGDFKFVVDDNSKKITFSRTDGKAINLDLSHALSEKVADNPAKAVLFDAFDKDGTGITDPKKLTSEDPTLTALTVVDHESSQRLINLLDQKIKSVSTARSNLGAVQNRFEHTITNLNVAVENLAASESRVRDTDMAQEMMQFTRNQILSQAGTSMLAQANQVPQGVLSLLR